MGWRDKVKPFGTGEQGAAAVAAPPPAPTGWKSRVRPFEATTTPPAPVSPIWALPEGSAQAPQSTAASVDSGSTPAIRAVGQRTAGAATSMLGGMARISPAMISAATSLSLPGMGPALTSALAPVMDPYTAPVAEELAEDAAKRNEIADIHASRADYPEATRIGSHVIAGLATQVPLGIATGGAAMIPVNSAASYNDALLEGKKAGLEGDELKQYAARAGTIEGGTTAVFQGLNKLLPGLGGAEAMFGKGAAKLTVPQMLKKMGISGFGELSEENLIGLQSAWNNYLSNVDPNAVDKGELWKGFVDTSLITLLTMGAMNTPAGVRAVKDNVAASAEKRAEAAKPTLTPEAAAEWAAQPANQAAAAKLADAVDKGNPVSRAIMQAMGLPNLDAERRAKFGAWVKQAVDGMIATANVPPVTPASPEASASPQSPPSVTPESAAMAATAAYEPANVSPAPQNGATWAGDVTQDPAWLARREAGTNKPPPKKKSLRTAGPTDETMSPEELGPQPKRVLGPMTPRMDVTATQEMPPEQAAVAVEELPAAQPDPQAELEAAINAALDEEFGVDAEKPVEQPKPKRSLKRAERLPSQPEPAPNVEATRSAAPAEGQVSPAVAPATEAKRGEAIPPVAEAAPPAAVESKVVPIPPQPKKSLKKAASSRPEKRQTKTQKAAAELKELRAFARKNVVGGVKTKAQGQFIEFVDDEFKPIYDAHVARERAKKFLRQRTGQNARLINQNEDRGRDEFKGYDEAAMDIPNNPDFAALGLSTDPAIAAQEIWNILKEGVLPPPSKTDPQFLARAAEYFNSLRSRRHGTASHPDIEITDFDAWASDDTGPDGSGGGRANPQEAESRRVQGSDSGVYEESGRAVRPDESEGDLAEGEVAAADDSFDFGANASPAKPAKKSIRTKAAARKEATAKERKAAAEELKRAFKTKLGFAYDPKRSAQELDQQIKAASRYAKAVINDGIATFAEYVAAVAEVMGYDDTLAMGEVLEKTWGLLRKRSGFEGIDEAGVTADVLKKPVAPLIAEVVTDEPAASAGGQDREFGIKHAKTDELRAKLGLPERAKKDSKPNEQLLEEALAKVDSDPQWIPGLIEELQTEKRALTALETAGFLVHRTDLELRLESGEDVAAQIFDSMEVSDPAGSLAGSALQARKLLLLADFSLAGIAAKHFDATGEKATASQRAEYEKMAARIRQLEAELEALQKKEAAAALDAIHKQHVEKSSSPAKKVSKKEALKKNVSDALSELKDGIASLYQFGAINDPRANAEKWVKITKAAGKVVKAYAELGVNSFLELASRVKADLGNITDDHLTALKEAWGEYRSSQLNIPADEKPEDSEIGMLARELHRWAVESGIIDREEAINAVHSELGGMGLELTREQVMEAMSGYGDYRELSKDEIDVKLREHRGELQQLLKLQDMAAGRAPKRSGVEQREKGEVERQLTKQVNEAKKKGGYEITDPDRQLKSAEGAAKTALNNRIADLEQEIKTREKIVKERTTLVPDAEILALRKRRDELLEEHKKIFPPQKAVLTLDQKMQMAEKAIDRQISTLDAEIKAGQIGPKPKGVPLTSPALEAKRAQLAALRDLRNRARAVDPAYQAKQAEKMLDAAKTAADKRIAELEKAIATRTKPVDNSKSVVPDAELTAKREQIAKLKEEFDKIFPKQKSALTDAQRMKMAEQALSNQIAKIEADLAAGNLLTKDKTAPLSSPEIEAKRKQLAALQEAREVARAADPAYQAQQAEKNDARYKASLEKRLKFWEQRRADAEKGILPVKRKPTPVSDAILEQKYQIELAKRQADAAIEEAAREKRTKSQKVLGFGGDLLDLSRGLMTTGELSYFFRQGAPYVLGFPVKAAKALAKSVTAAFSRRADFALHDDLRQRKNYSDQVRGGLVTTASDGPLSQREELMRSRLVSQLAAKQGILWTPTRWAAESMLGFERAFRSFMNTMRADLFDYMKSSVNATRPGTWSEDDAKIIASASNIFSGRAEMPGAVGLSRIFFAPSWVWSNVQLLAAKPLWKGDSATRLAIGKVYVRAMLGAAAAGILRHAVYSLLAGDDDDRKPKYETDPRSSDFMKTRLGDTRLDSGRGLSQLVVLGARLAPDWMGGGKTKTSSGKLVSIRGEDVPRGADDSRDIIHRFLDSKLAPLPSAVLDYIVGANIVGKEVTAGSIVSERTMPMTWRDIWSAEKELGVAQGTVAAIDAFLGTGISTYGIKSEYREASPEDRAKIDKSLMHAADDLVSLRPGNAEKAKVWQENTDVAYNKLMAIGRSDAQLIREYGRYLAREIKDEKVQEEKLNRFIMRLNARRRAAKK